MHLNDYLQQGMLHEVREGHPVWLVKPFTVQVFLTTAASERTQELVWCFEYGCLFNDPRQVFRLASFYGTVVIGLASEHWISDIDMRYTVVPKASWTTRVRKHFSAYLSRLATLLKQ